VIALRTAFGAATLFLVIALRRGSFRSPPIVPTAILGLLNTAIFFLVQTLAVLGGAGKAAVLAYTYPFWIALAAWPLLGERIALPTRIGLLLAAAGLSFVLFPLDFGHAIVSKLLALGAAVDFTFAAIYTKRMRATYDVDLLSLTAWATLYGAIPLVIVAVALPNQTIHLTPQFLAAIAYISVFGTAAGLLLWLFALSRLPTGAAAIASLLAPVVAVIFAWFQLGERPAPPELLGMGLIVAALVVDAAPALLQARKAEL
jgi:drug/metabolite transporter (DMT)-like permease